MKKAKVYKQHSTVKGLKAESSNGIITIGDTDKDHVLKSPKSVANHMIGNVIKYMKKAGMY
jgi:hypothetical protein